MRRDDDVEGVSEASIFWVKGGDRAFGGLAVRMVIGRDGWSLEAFHLTDANDLRIPMIIRPHRNLTKQRR